MKGKTKFSVVTVVYNGSSEIQKTIESVLEQSYNNIEYIIIDGQSTDNTIDIIGKFSSRITKIISEKDNGLYDAMNKGINLVSGDYIIFMNGGDTFASENTLQLVSDQIFESLNNLQPDFIYGDSFEESADGKSLFYKKARSHKFAWYGMFTHHQSMIYKAEIIKSNNLFFNQKFTIAADYLFTLDFLNSSPIRLKVNFPICIFKQGGLSSDWICGIKEQWEIRRKIFKYSAFRCFVILVIHWIVIQLKNKLGPVYKKLRYK